MCVCISCQSSILKHTCTIHIFQRISHVLISVLNHKPIKNNHKFICSANCKNIKVIELNHMAIKYNLFILTFFFTLPLSLYIFYLYIIDCVIFFMLSTTLISILYEKKHAKIIKQTHTHTYTHKICLPMQMMLVKM